METRKPYDEQAMLWNGQAGRAWVEARDVLDPMFQPLEDLLVQAVAQRGGRRVLDVGCGTGSTTLAVARHLGSAGECTGVDLSAPMIAAARARAEREHLPARFIEADAQRHAFAADSFDTIVSRFGVMFFDDPVRAFANLRRATSADAALCFLAWRGPDDNPFMTTAERAAAPLVPSLPARQPDAPGQFAFADRDRVHRILRDSGWTGIEVRPVDVACAFPASELVRYLTLLGPLGRVFGELDPRTRDQVIAVVSAAFAPYVQGDQVRFVAACWMVSAR